jgi:hypothetical protein
MPNLTFETVHALDLGFEKPIPAKNILPKWWKDADTYFDGKQEYVLNEHGFGFNNTFKKCFPLLDTLTAGYVVKLHTDVAFFYRDGEQLAGWSSHFRPVENWDPNVSNGFNVPSQYYSEVYKWVAQWYFKTPPGYSCLITHPYGYEDLPFRSITGIVDTDKLETDINTPFLMNKDFEGTIPAGTPLYQIIPFKREEWTHDFRKIDPTEKEKRYEKWARSFTGSYQKHFRSRKSFK